MTHPALEKCSTIIEFPVAWGDMDAFDHVNNAKYFTYFESARIRYFEEIGWGGRIDSVGPILSKTDCRFRIPVTYPDTLQVGTYVSEIGEDRVLMVNIVVSLNHNAVAAEGSGHIVSFDYRSGKKARIPDVIRHAMIERDHPAAYQFKPRT